MSRRAATPRKRRQSRLRRVVLPSWEVRKRIFVPQVWIVVVASYLAIFFAFTCPQDLRSDSTIYVGLALAAFMIRTFLFHLGVFVLALMVGIAFLRRWQLLITAIPLLVFTLGPALGSYVPRRASPLPGDTVRVMSVNLLHANQTTDPIVAEVRAARPDLLLLQEYTPRWHQVFQAALADDYPFVRSVRRDDSFGVAVYANRPFVGPANLDLPIGTLGLPQTRVVVRIAGRDVALYNVHLLPPKRLRWAIEQRWEFADLLDQLRSERLPTVLCGDFNFTNASVFADRLERAGLTDAHRISGWGRGSTWPVLGPLRYVPGIRLDHVFLSHELTSTHSRSGTGRGSDHRPVVAEIGFSGERK